jgi:hypothetical protein
MTPKAIRSILDLSGSKLIWFHQSQTPGYIEILCSMDQGCYRVECLAVEGRTFLIRPDDLPISWRLPLLARQRERLESLEQIIDHLNAALYETFNFQQGHARITLEYRLPNGHYGLRFQPSIVKGFNPNR